jgi:hypothetical protein
MARWYTCTSIWLFGLRDSVTLLAFGGLLAIAGAELLDAIAATHLP